MRYLAFGLCCLFRLITGFLLFSLDFLGPVLLFYITLVLRERYISLYTGIEVAVCDIEA
jgi:hypothetical protein